MNIETKRQVAKIIIDKCAEREAKGYDSLTDPDVADIRAECARKGIDVSHSELVYFMETGGIKNDR